MLGLQTLEVGITDSEEEGELDPTQKIIPYGSEDDDLKSSSENSDVN